MDTDCILATKSINSSGYAHFSKNGKTVSYHRNAWIEAHGEIPKGMIVRHKCRNRTCYNVDHLEVGTYQQNNDDDKRRDGTDQCGEKSKSHKLTNDQVNLIKQLYASKSQKELAKDFGVSQGLISLILNAQRRKHG